MLCIQKAIELVTNCQLSFFVSVNEPGFLFFNLQSNQVRYDGSVNFSCWDVVVLNIYNYVLVAQMYKSLLLVECNLTVTNIYFSTIISITYYEI